MFGVSCGVGRRCRIAETDPDHQAVNPRGAVPARRKETPLRFEEWFRREDGHDAAPRRLF